MAARHLFGSVARNEATPDSDVDIDIVDFDDDSIPGLFGFVCGARTPCSGVHLDDGW